MFRGPTQQGHMETTVWVLRSAKHKPSRESWGNAPAPPPPKKKDQAHRVECEAF